MIHNIHSQTDLSGFYLVYDGSTLLETPGLRGATHLLEHLMCKSFEHLQDELQRKGIAWNAYTSSNEMVFWFTGLEEQLTPYRPKILQLMQEFKITPEQFDNEKKIVLQEYKDVFKEQLYGHYENMMRRRFGNYGPIGWRGDLEALKLEDLQAMFRTWYREPTKILNVSNRYHHANGRKMPANIVADQILVSPQEEPKLDLDGHFERTTSIILQTEPMTTDIAIAKVLLQCLFDGLNSPMAQELREKRGLCYSVWHWNSRFNREYLASLMTSVADENADQAIDKMLEILRDPEGYVTAGRLEVVREQHIIEDQIATINRYANVAPWMTEPEYQIRSVINTVTLEDVHRVAMEHFAPGKLWISIDKRHFPRPAFPQSVDN